MNRLDAGNIGPVLHTGESHKNQIVGKPNGAECLRTHESRVRQNTADIGPLHKTGVGHVVQIVTGEIALVCEIVGDEEQSCYTQRKQNQPKARNAWESLHRSKISRRALSMSDQAGFYAPWNRLLVSFVLAVR